MQQLAASGFHVLAAARPGTPRQLPPGRVTPLEGDMADPVFVGRALEHALYAREEELSTSLASRAAFVNLQIFRLNGKLAHRLADHLLHET